LNTIRLSLAFGLGSSDWQEKIGPKRCLKTKCLAKSTPKPITCTSQLSISTLKRVFYH